MNKQNSLARIYLSLGALYVVQGLPFGFQATALPVMMRERGASLTTIGLLSLLSLPWALKPLWAPWLERGDGDGVRRRWILRAQLGLMMSCLLGAVAASAGDDVWLLGAVLLMNLFAATQDIAVDGLAVDVLRGGDLGPANAAQVVGYKVGMMLGGGLLVWASASIGWTGLFLAMATLVAIVWLQVWRWPLCEPARTETAATTPVWVIVRRLWRALRQTGPAVILVIALYKAGETMMDVLLKPMLVDAGISAGVIGLWVGSYGMVASVAGSLAGGWLVSRAGLYPALLWCAVARVIPALAQLWLSTTQITTDRLAFVTVVEHLAGGALTTAMFAWMMSRVDRRVGASHFTLFAALEVLGKSPGAWIAGPMAERWGYSCAMTVGLALSVGYVALLMGLKSRLRTVD